MRARLIRALDFYLMNYRRLFLAFLVSPLMALFVFIVTTMALGVPSGEILIGLIFYIPLTYLVAAVLGLPMFLLSRSLGWKNVFAYILGGATVGLIEALFLLGLFSRNMGLEFLLCPIAGGLSALLFWLILYGIKYDEKSVVSTDDEI